MDAIDNTGCFDTFMLLNFRVRLFEYKITIFSSYRKLLSG